MQDEAGARRLWGPPVVLLLAWLVLLLTPLRDFLNADGVSYATLSVDWAEGRDEAVNGYWSPLLPMLGAPLVAAGVPSVLALRLVLLACALLLPALVADLTRRVGGGVVGGRLAAWVSVPFLLGASLYGVYPDLLFVLLALSFVRWVLDPRLLVPGPGRWWVAVAAGLSGGAAYLAKAIGLPLVLGLGVLALGWQLSRAGRARDTAPVPRRTVLASWAVVLGCLGAASLPWVVAISLQGGGPTISTAGGWNAQLVAAGSRGNPMDFPGFYPPPREEAVSAWIDPAQIPVDPPASFGADPAAASGADPGTGPVASALRVDNVLRQLQVVGRVLAGGWLVPVGLAAAGLVLTARARRPEVLARQVALVVASAALTAGSALLIVIPRYLWFAELVLLPVAVTGLLALTARRARLRAVLAAVLVLSIAALPVRDLTIRAGVDSELRDAVSAVRADGGLTGGLAGAGSWSDSQLLCFALSCQYVGMVSPELSLPALEDRLRRAGAAHLVLWDEGQGLAAELPDREGARLPGGALLYAVTPEGLRPAAG